MRLYEVMNVSSGVLAARETAAANQKRPHVVMVTRKNLSTSTYSYLKIENGGWSSVHLVEWS